MHGEALTAYLDPDAEMKALFMETKRCILYIIRVRSGANLMEIMVKPPTDEDQGRWREPMDKRGREGKLLR